MFSIWSQEPRKIWHNHQSQPSKTGVAQRGEERQLIERRGSNPTAPGYPCFFYLKLSSNGLSSYTAMSSPPPSHHLRPPWKLKWIKAAASSHLHCSITRLNWISKRNPTREVTPPGGHLSSRENPVLPYNLGGCLQMLQEILSSCYHADVQRFNFSKSDDISVTMRLRSPWDPLTSTEPPDTFARQQSDFRRSHHLPSTCGPSAASKPQEHTPPHSDTCIIPPVSCILSVSLSFPASFVHAPAGACDACATLQPWQTETSRAAWRLSQLRAKCGGSLYSEPTLDPIDSSTKTISHSHPCCIAKVCDRPLIENRHC